MHPAQEARQHQNSHAEEYYSVSAANASCIGTQDSKQVAENRHECRSKQSADPVNLGAAPGHPLPEGRLVRTGRQRPQTHAKESTADARVDVPGGAPASDIDEHAADDKAKGEAEGLAESQARKREIAAFTTRKSLGDERNGR
jgi:hypothetical protein